MNRKVKTKWKVLSLVLALVLGLSIIAPETPLSVFAQNGEKQTETKDEVSAQLLLNTETDQEEKNYDPDQTAKVSLKDGFTEDQVLSFTKLDGNQTKDATDAVKKKTKNEDFTILSGWSLSLAPEKEDTDDENKETYDVSLYLKDLDPYKKDTTELYHVDGDKTEKLDFTVEKDEKDPDHPKEYVSFKTKSLSSFLFITENSNGGGTTAASEKPEVTSASEPSATPDNQATPESVATPEVTSTPEASATPEPVATPEATSTPEPTAAPVEKKDIHTAKELKSGDFKLKAGPLKVKKAANEVNSKITNFNAALFYGASKKDDGIYEWDVPQATDEYKAGHRFIFRLTYGISELDVPANAVSFTIPQHILTNRDNQSADNMEWSIPSRDEVNAATDENGKIDEEQISPDVTFAYYADEKGNFVIYNFRELGSSNTGYIEFAYVTAQNSFAYKDMQTMTPFTATMSYKNNNVSESKTTDPIRTRINTTANLTSVTKRAPYSKTNNWNDNWGKPADFGITDPNDYYYLLWDIRSTLTATQPYTISIQDTMTSRHGYDQTNDNEMSVIGYRFSGQERFSKYNSDNPEDNAVQSNIRRERWDQVLTAIPKNVYNADTSYWEANNTVSVTLTPIDEPNNSKTKKSSAKWTWTKPQFHDVSGSFASYKRGDGAWRAYNGSVFQGTTHSAANVDFNAGNYSRYDLEEFNGYNSESKKSDLPVTRDIFGGFDFAAWIVGRPGNTTQDKTSFDPDAPWNSYWKKNVSYELTDDGVYLLNDEKALISGNGDKNRTIENDSINKNNAVKLENGDYRIDKLEYSYAMTDAQFDDETQSFKSSAANYDPEETITFEGKFDDSQEYVAFATYNLSTKKFNFNNTYVASMDEKSIVFKDNVNLLAYKVKTENKHYYSEVFTVPFYCIKNSEKVTDLLKDHDRMVLVNNVNSVVKNSEGVTISTGAHSDADYATVSKKNSSLTKNVISTSNNARQRYYTITWRIIESETIQSGEDGNIRDLPQQSGVFYDLLPDGAELNSNSVVVRNGTSATYTQDGRILDPSAYEVKTISNFKNTGRTLLVINIKTTGNHFVVTYDTQHSWNSIKDYGDKVNNPVAYETGNESIYGGSPDNGGKIKDQELLNNVAVESQMSSEKVTGNRFLFAENEWDINAITSGANGLSKKVKLDNGKRYGTSADAHINSDYSYEIRFMNNYGYSVSNMVFFDSLENYPADNPSSDWHGILQSVDVSQLKKKGIDPVLYISEKENLNPSVDNNLDDTTVWEEVNDKTDLSSAKAIAVDARKSNDDKKSDYSLKADDSVAFHLYMKAPSQDNGKKNPEDAGYPYAYNNVYMNYRLSGSKDDQLIHQDYTKVSLTVAADVSLQKISETDGKPASGIAFRLYGTSDYNNEIDLSKKTDVDGNLSFKDVEKGKYTLQETDAGDDFLLDPTQHTVIVEGTGNVKIDGQDYNGQAFTVQDKPRIHADVKFIKTDSISGNALKGAEFTLKGRGDYGTDILQTAESNDDGIVSFKNIEKGTYTLKESKAPEDTDKEGQGDHVIDATEHKVVIDDNGNSRIFYTPVIKYSHTSNIDDNGKQISDYGNSWDNSDITGTDRGIRSNAHVVTIPGAKKLIVDITWGTVILTSGYNNSDATVCVWSGNHPNFTTNDRDSNPSPTVLRGGPHNNNHQRIEINGDSVTFGFSSYYYLYNQNSNYYTGDHYGYYAKITADSDEIDVGRKNGYLNLENEPLHSISFEKMSSYDQTPLAGAEFSLNGTSDAGTLTDRTAVSAEKTGIVRFGNLEAGNYTLREENAPEGFKKDDNSYTVSVKTDGRFTIQNLVKNKEGTYQIFDIKKKDKQITVTKIWDDGEVHTDPRDLNITLSDEKPNIINRKYKILFDAGKGGYFDNNPSETTNTVTYNYENKVEVGTYKEPTVLEDGYPFYQWVDKDGDPFSVEQTLTNNDMNGILDGETIHLYARPLIQKYAVMLYGIGQDVDENGKTMGLTFGPATGDDFTNKYNSHKPTGTDKNGNLHRCIHDDDWETIVDWNKKDPYVYEQCIENDCTHSVELKVNKDARNNTFIGNSVDCKDGDGVGILRNVLIKKGYENNLDWSETSDYSSSIIRAELNGADEKTDLENKKFNFDNSILSAFPKELRDAIGNKNISYGINDKLWVPSGYEVFGEYYQGKDIQDSEMSGAWYDNMQRYNDIDGNQYQRCIRIINSGKYDERRYAVTSDVPPDYYHETDFESLVSYSGSDEAGSWYLRSIAQMDDDYYTIQGAPLLVDENGSENITSRTITGISPCFSLSRTGN